MERRFNNLLLFLLTLALSASAQSWRPLFDGKSTEGWVEVTGKPVPPNSWTVQDGCLKTVVTPEGAQDIRTVDSFHSFDLEFDWKVLANGNSGVKYLLQKIDEWNNKSGRQARARGFEYQLADNSGPDVSRPERATASLYGAIAPSPLLAPRIGEFNHSRIVLKGDHVEHWLNGVKVVSFELGQPQALEVFSNLKAPTPVRRDTPISLQNHGTEAWFKNIRIRASD